MPNPSQDNLSHPARRRVHSSLLPILLASLALHALLALMLPRFSGPATGERIFEIDLRQAGTSRPTSAAPRKRLAAAPKISKPPVPQQVIAPKVLSKPPRAFVISRPSIITRPTPPPQRYPAPRPEQIPTLAPASPQPTVVATPQFTEVPATPVPVATPLPAATTTPLLAKRPKIPAPSNQTKPTTNAPAIAPTTAPPAPIAAPGPAAAPSTQTGAGSGDGTGSGSGTGSGKGTGSGTGEGSGSGSGKGNGAGQGAGRGEGTGQGNGTGSGEGSGQGTGSGQGSGAGDGKGNGQGNGSGDGNSGSGGEGGSGGSGGGGNGGGGGGSGGSGGNGGGGGGNGGGNGGLFGLKTGGSGPRHIVYLLDISRSMIPRIDRARQELRDELKSLQPGESFNIIGFYADVRGFSFRLEEAKPDTITKASTWLDKLELRGGTDFEKPLKMALSLPRVNVVVLISDGDPSLGQTNHKKLTRLIRNANRNRARIFTIGLVGRDPFGEDRSPKATQLLQQIAKDNGGECKIHPLD